MKKIFKESMSFSLVKILQHELRILILVTVCLSNYSVSAQCKVEEDAFSGKRRIMGSKKIELRGSNSRFKSISLFSIVKESNDSIFLNIDFKTGDIIAQKMLKTDQVLLKLKDGTIIECFPTDEVTPTKIVTTAEATSVYRISMRVSLEDLQKISKNSWEAIQINIDKKYDLLPHKMQRNTLNKIAQCILTK